MFSNLGHFFLSWCFCYLKGWSFRCSLGWGNAGRCAVTLYVEEGPIGSNGACSSLCWISAIPSATHNQIGPFWCCFPHGWVCVHSRTLWVSPWNSPVRLGVFLLSPQPPQVFSIRGLRLYFPALEPWVAWSALLPCRSFQFICARMWGHRVCQLQPGLPIPQSASSLGLPGAALPPVLSAPAAGLPASYWSG